MVVIVRRIIQKFSSFVDAERADNAYYRGLTYTEKLKILICLIGHKDPKDGIIQRRIRIYPLAQPKKS